jgi:tRNA-intron endonuclease
MEKEQKEQEQKKTKVKAIFYKDAILTENIDAAREFYNQSRFGEIEQDGKLRLSLIEAYYLIDKEKLEMFDKRNQKIKKQDFLKKATKTDPYFLTRYAVFGDLRNRGYIVKTALKFGADFRVYDRGIKPGEDHAKWVVFPVKEDTVLTWYEFAAKNRVAHSTKKRLLLGVVDDEGDVSYWECRWIRP